jgi:glycine/D-amino acid oxidase-like deaminating enzyme
MIDSADVVVIGSGGLGAATAYYLAKRGGIRVALLDKHGIGSQTSPRAAGMVSCVRKSDLMVDLIKDACRKIESFSDEIGQPLDWVLSGSIKVARRPQDGDVIAADFDRGRRMGLDVERVSAAEAHSLNPFLQPTDIIAAMRIGDDRYFDAAQVALGFARGAEAKGATLLPGIASSPSPSATVKSPACELTGESSRHLLWLMLPVRGRDKWRRPAESASRSFRRASSWS